jgi:hypothetical protein
MDSSGRRFFNINHLPPSSGMFALVKSGENWQESLYNNLMSANYVVSIGELLCEAEENTENTLEPERFALSTGDFFFTGMLGDKVKIDAGYYLNYLDEPADISFEISVYSPDETLLIKTTSINTGSTGDFVLPETGQYRINLNTVNPVAQYGLKGVILYLEP